MAQASDLGWTDRGSRDLRPHAAAQVRAWLMALGCSTEARGRPQPVEDSVSQRRFSSRRSGAARPPRLPSSPSLPHEEARTRSPALPHCQPVAVEDGVLIPAWGHLPSCGMHITLFSSRRFRASASVSPDAECALGTPQRQRAGQRLWECSTC